MAGAGKAYILFDDHHRDHLLPLVFTRPVSEIRIGILTIREKWEKWLGNAFSYYTQDYLRERYPILPEEDNILINGSIAPNNALVEEILSLVKGEVLMQDGLFIAGYLDRDALKEFVGLPPKNSVFRSTQTHFNHISKLWHIFRLNGDEIRSDFHLITSGRVSAAIQPTNHLIHPENIFVEEGASLDFATINASSGPVYIGRNAQIMEGCLIRGPFALCEGAVMKMGTMIYGPTTIGPFSKAGGEITNSVMMGYSNKVHEGYLGNSVLGEWCNIGAGTNTSNLKNNLAPVKLWNYATGKFDDTDLQFCGLIMGDYARCGINTMFNTGTVVGISANIFGTGFPGNFIPSFSWGGAAGVETYRLPKALESIEMGMALQQRALDEKVRSIIIRLFSLTGHYRKTI